MDRLAFKQDTRYTLTLLDEHGKARPASLYVYRVYEKFMVARETGGAAQLCKVPYERVVAIVDEAPIGPAARYLLPAAVLDEKTWKDRDTMQHYASAPGRGK
jgi:hypothetical protein